jgi:hypothetical protein
MGSIARPKQVFLLAWKKYMRSLPVICKAACPFCYIWEHGIDHEVDGACKKIENS